MNRLVGFGSRVFVVTAFVAALGFAGVTFNGATAKAEPVVIKLATSAPNGSLWFKELAKIGTVVEKLTEGRVKIKIFGGSVLGDDKQVLDKMKFGQVQAAAFTGVGLGEIVSRTRLMELPFVFENPAQIDCVLGKMLSGFEADLVKAGYVNLGWAEQGLIYVYSGRPIQTTAEMAKTKPWVWGADVLARSIFEVFGLKPVPLALQDVYMSLQSGIIDTVYISPAALTGLGWHAKTPNMVDVPVVNGAGAVLVKKEVWDKISPADQEVLMKTSKSVLTSLIGRARDENNKAIKVLQEKNGVKVYTIAAGERSGFAKKGAEAADRLVGKLFSKRELDEFRAAVAACKSAR